MSDEAAVIVIPMVPDRELSPNARVHWGERSRAVQAFRKAAFYATLEQLTGAQREWAFFQYRPSDMEPVLVMDVEIAWTKDRKHHDDDNAWAMIKAARDGVAQALHIDDVTFKQGELKQTSGNGVTVITLRSLAGEGA